MASKQLQEAKNMRLQIDLKFNLVRWKKNKSICLFGFIEQTNRFVVAMLCNCVLAHTPPANLLRQCFLFFCFFSQIQMIYQIENYAITTHRIECVMMKQKKKIYDQTQRPITDYDTVCNR